MKNISTDKQIAIKDDTMVEEATVDDTAKTIDNEPIDELRQVSICEEWMVGAHGTSHTIQGRG